MKKNNEMTYEDRKLCFYIKRAKKFNEIVGSLLKERPDIVVGEKQEDMPETWVKKLDKWIVRIKQEVGE